MDIKLETLRYHLVIFGGGGDFFTIDQSIFYCKSGSFVIQNRNTSFHAYLSCAWKKNITSVPDSYVLIMWLIFALIEPQIVNIIFQEIFKYSCCH